MGLFGNVFNKKTCDICGEDIGLLGNRKLEDGNCCKKCAAKLSPWFSDRRSSTVEDIKAQLAYREENRNAVAAFESTRTFGEQSILHIDENNGTFLISKTGRLEDENPDVLNLSQITGVDLNIDESRREVMREVRDREGKIQKKSYTPRHYIYSYNFYIVIRVNHPYFDEMKLKLNRNNVEIEVIERSGVTAGGITRANEGYRYYEKQGSELKSTLMRSRNQVRKAAEKAAAPKAARICPFCGATTIPNESGCCEYCGAPMA